MTAIGASSAAAATTAGAVGAIGSALPAIAGVATAGGALYSGYKAKQGADFEAKQMKIAGDNALAEGQRKAMGQKRQTDLVLSRARAVSASSGGGPTGGSVDAIMEGIRQQGEYNESVAYWEGKDNRNKAYASASSRKQSGKNALVGGAIKGATALSSGGSFYDYYAKGT